MGALRETFTSIAPRERSGSRAANRFDYQDDWALCKLIELHESENDYVLVLEFHDDVVILDSKSDPTSLMFFQIKTKTSGHHSRSDLTRQRQGKNGKLPSILGKLYSNYITFPVETQQLSLVSNAYTNCKLQAGGTGVGQTKLAYSDLADSERKEIKESLSIERAEAVDASGVALFVYEVSELSLIGHTDHALGRLTRFLDSLPKASSHIATAFYRALKGELSRRAKSEATIRTFDEVCEFKAIDRESFRSMLRIACAVPATADAVLLLRQRLDAENVSFPRVGKICKAARQFAIGRLDPTERIIAEAEELVVGKIRASAIDEIASLDAVIEVLYECCSKDSKFFSWGLDPFYIRAIIGVKYIEEQELQDPDSHAEEEAS